MNLKSLSNNVLTERLRDLSQRDLKLTAEIVVHIHEFMIRRLYLDHGSTSVFSYLVDQLGYSRATAQNRIDAARLLGDVPEIAEDLASGKIGLGQITLMSIGIRQVEKEDPGVKVSADQKRDLVEKLKAAKAEAAKADVIRSESGQTESRSAQLVAGELDIKINKAEKVRFHRDGSVTVEVHLSKEEFEDLKRVREVNAHKNHNAKLGETVAAATKFFLEKKDPLKLKTNIVAPPKESSQEAAVSIESDSGRLVVTKSKPVVSSSSNLTGRLNARVLITPTQSSHSSRKYISVHVARAIHQRDQTCQWIDPTTGQICGSTYQLQLDHIRGLAHGGTNEIENLELKCALHNRWKFELERLVGTGFNMVK